MVPNFKVAKTGRSFLFLRGPPNPIDPTTIVSDHLVTVDKPICCTEVSFHQAASTKGRPGVRRRTQWPVVGVLAPSGARARALCMEATQESKVAKN